MDRAARGGHRPLSRGHRMSCPFCPFVPLLCIHLFLDASLWIPILHVFGGRMESRTAKATELWGWEAVGFHSHPGLESGMAPHTQRE